VRGHQVAELVERLHSGGGRGHRGGNAVSDHVADRWTATRAGRRCAPPSLPLGFSVPLTREQLVEPRTGGRDRVGGRLALIFSVDSAAECFGAGRQPETARQAGETKKKGTRRHATSMAQCDSPPRARGAVGRRTTRDGERRRAVAASR
jgi:hypothetical protein